MVAGRQLRALGVALVNWESGLTLGSLGGGKYRAFLYLVLDRPKSNLALARHNLRRIESALNV